jgi:hypothetical protein
MTTVEEQVQKELNEEARKRAEMEVLHRQQSYLSVFNKESPLVLEVLEDLAAFCRAHESCFHADPRIQSMLEGRREVWLRIERQLELSSQKLWSLYEQRKF